MAGDYATLSRSQFGIRIAAELPTVSWALAFSGSRTGLAKSNRFVKSFNPAWHYRNE